MKIGYARRCEELTMENAALRKQIADERAANDKALADLAEKMLADIESLRKGNAALIRKLNASNSENRYLLRTNYELAKAVGKKPVATRLNTEEQ